ncbi:MAG: exonuclease SbcCD subunit D [Spirochaetaceae bacterium]|jgi:exonuclease SbcD|nr:exonuclease SbcCD subunit D [Spirochaetaceae bacterium]
MKFLHTADLHLGKVFHEHSLLEDQRHMLRQLAEILSEPSWEALLIAGDVYDRSIPSPEAVSLFSGFLGQLKFQRPDLEILILPGNHDSAVRLGFGKELFSALGIHFVTDPNDAVKPVTVGGGQCSFFLLPFLHPGSLSARLTAGEPAGAASGAASGPEGETPLRSQAKLAAEAAARLEAARLEALAAGSRWAVLGAHLFAGGGQSSESERIFLGSAEQVDLSPFAGFDYTGLGHLHRRQQAGERAWYSGSPLAYSFGEGAQEKSFLQVELSAGREAAVTPLPVRPLRKLVSLTGSFSYFYRESVGDPAVGEAEEAYLEVTLTGTDLTANPLPLLRQRFPWILSVRQNEAFAALRREAPPGTVISGERRTLADDFRDFLAGIYGEGFTDDEKTGLFRELLEEVRAGGPP